ncbi:hypothetical protein EVAR_33675_1 [Eumeta japonica]|uniref:Uncharacterized protein n=1 Tax=Eumeta variegata TaxID=151549 RepID=A0A4C1VPK8_EUMVA|nr:hypothetical protein EVAR_33675_1 [Eumeta japonica]
MASVLATKLTNKFLHRVELFAPCLEKGFKPPIPYVAFQRRQQSLATLRWISVKGLRSERHDLKQKGRSHQRLAGLSKRQRVSNEGNRDDGEVERDWTAGTTEEAANFNSVFYESVVFRRSSPPIFLLPANLPTIGLYRSLSRRVRCIRRVAQAYRRSQRQSFNTHAFSIFSSFKLRMRSYRHRAVLGIPPKMKALVNSLTRFKPAREYKSRTLYESQGVCAYNSRTYINTDIKCCSVALIQVEVALTSSISGKAAGGGSRASGSDQTFGGLTQCFIYIAYLLFASI